jgi:DNA-binding MarR family transcriptional regulator
MKCRETEHLGPCPTDDPLTSQQALVYHYISQGYPMSEAARLIGISPSLVSDQIGFIRKKGYTCDPVGAYRTKIKLRDVPSH